MATLRAVATLALLVLLLCELLATLPRPWAPCAHGQQQRRQHAWPAAAGDAGHPVRYHSRLLLRRCQSFMKYSRALKRYETPPLAVWCTASGSLVSDPAAGWAAMQQLVLTARQPWAMFWGFALLPPAWHVMPEQVAVDLALVQAGVPVLRLDRPELWYGTAPKNNSRALFRLELDADSSGSGIKHWVKVTLTKRLMPLVPSWHAVCSSAVDGDTLRPAAAATCVVHERGNASAVIGSFTVAPDAVPATAATVSRPSGDAADEGEGLDTCPATADDSAESLASPAADGSSRSSSSSSSTTRAHLRSCPALGKGLVLMPALGWLHDSAQRWWPTGLLANAAVQLWRVVVPSGSLSRPLCHLAQHMQLLAGEFPVKAALLYVLVLGTCLRNWLYLITVAYKIQRRLAIVAQAPLPARLSGTALTLLGMFLGLWQSLLYTSLDLAIDVALAKSAFIVADSSLLLATALWHVSLSCGLLELRLATKLWKLGKLLWQEGRTLVLTPHALLRQAADLDRVPRRVVPTVGSWPQPLVVPDEVDELPVTEVPRGFICPITQSIMRQPALLLHDRTIAPSTYDKEAIAEWLATHSSDPKNPGTKLCMKSVRLVYNGDLGRAIEDWVGARVAASRQQQQHEQQQAAQQQLSLASLQAWLSGQLEALHHPGQQQQQAAAAAGLAGMGSTAADLLREGGAVSATAAAGLLAHLRGQQQRAAAAAAAAAGGGLNDVDAHDAAAAGPQPAAPAASGSILSDAVRTSSAALMHVASLDLPAVAAAGLTHLAANTTRRITRTAVRQQQGAQLQAAGHPQQQGQQWRQQQQQQDDREPGIDTDGSGGGSSDGEVSSRREGGGDGSGRAQRQRQQAGGGSSGGRQGGSVRAAAAAAAAAAGGAGSSGAGRSLRRRTPPAAAAESH